MYYKFVYNIVKNIIFRFNINKIFKFILLYYTFIYLIENFENYNFFNLIG